MMHSIVDNLMNNTGRTIKRKVEDFLSNNTGKSKQLPYINPIAPKVLLEILLSGCCTLSWSLVKRISGYMKIKFSRYFMHSAILIICVLNNVYKKTF